MRSLLFLLLSAPILTLAQPTFRNTAVTKNIDLQGPLTTQSTTYSAKLVQLDAGEQEATEFQVVVPDAEDTLAWFEAREKKGGKLGNQLQWRKADSSSTYIITLPTPLKLNQSIQLSTTVVLTDSAIPKPAAITQNEEQYLLWRGDAAINSVYHTESGRVKIKSPTPQILAHSSPPTAYTQDAPFTKSGATITLGPYINVPAYTSTLGGQPFEVHYRFADPVITVKNLKRSVEVSHWGNNLNIQDELTLVNTGPILKGQFSRIDYMRSKSQRHFPAQVLSDLTIRLPPKIHTPYVYDVIGNVSTTHFRPSADPAIGRAAARPSASAGESVLELRPRYPLLGGWEYNFTLGWDQELGESLRKDPEGDGWTLAVGFLTALDGVQYEKVEWTVVLPEGATDIELEAPFPLSSPAEHFTHTTYLDTFGRPAVRIVRDRCTDRCSALVYVKYRLSWLAHFQKPFAVSTVVLGLLLGAMGLRTALGSDVQK